MKKPKRGSGVRKPNNKQIMAVIPTNWCDPLLSGDKAVLGNPPYSLEDIERLLWHIRQRLMKRLMK